MKTPDVPQDIFELIGKSEDIEQAAQAMKAISHPLRLKILCILSSGEINVQEIVEACGTSQSNISQHLSVLKSKKILKSRKDANRVLYRIADDRILSLVSMTRQVFCVTK
jgi:DNA-binding transcriptional ArsR family regulator